MVKGLFIKKVPSRNFLKIRSESFQYVRLCIGVPKGTYELFFNQKSLSQIQLIKDCFQSEKVSFLKFKNQDMFGQLWTSKEGKRFRIGSETIYKTYNFLKSSKYSNSFFNFFKVLILNKLGVVNHV